MGQYKTGGVDVTSGSQSVIGNGTTWLGQVAPGNLFIRQGSGVWYLVGSVIDDTHLMLTTPYVAATESNVSYSLTRDFTPVRGIPLIEPGDIDTPTILKRAFLIIDGLL